LPVVSAGANQALCISTPNFLLTGFSPAGGVWSGTGITNAITGQFDPAVSGVGTFTLSYSFTNSVTHCTGVSTKQITVNPLPVVNAGTGSTYCNAPIPVTLTGYTPAGGSWSGAGVLIGGTFTPSAAGNGLTVLSYSFTDVNGCSATDTIQVRVVAPALAIAGNNDTVCIGSGLLTLSGFSPAGGNWTGTGITNASGVFNPAVSGVGSFTLTYSYGVGTCANSSTKTVVVHALPVVSAGADRVSCINVPAFNLSGASPAGGVWTGTGITNAAPGTFNPATAGAGTFTMTYTFTDPVTHCLNTATVKETVNPIPVVNAGTGTTYCNQPIPLTLTGYTPTGGTWSGTGVSASGVFNPAVPGNGPVVLTYSFTDANGCISQDTLNEKVISPALALAGPTDTICINAGLLTLNGFSPAGGTWSGTGITNPTGIFDPVIAGVGSHSIVYSYGAGTCFNTSSKNVIVHAAPVVLAGGNEITCISTPPYTLSGFSPAGGTWTGTGITNGVAATFSPSNAGAGTFTLTYSFTSPITHCTSTASKTVTVGALPIVQFTNPNPGCIAAPVLFTDNTTGASTYAWNFGDGGQSAIQTPAYSYAAAGTYTIHLVATTTLGCKDSAKSTLVILPNPRAVFTTTPDSGCSPLSVSFVNSSVVANGTISWNLGNGQSSTALTPPPQTYLQGINDTLYHVSLTITNQCAVSTAKDSVRIHPKPEAGFGTNVSSGCSPATFAFHNTTTGLPKTFNWNFGDGTTGTGPLPPAHTYTYTGKKDTVYVIQLIATNSCGTDTASQQVIVYPNTVKAFFNTSSVSGCVPHSVTFSNFSTGGNSIAWNFGDGNISTQTNPTHIYLTPGTYTVSQFVTNGCSYDTARNVITVHPNAALVFSAAPTPACVSHAVLFTNASTNAGGFVWHFGDGTTSTVNSPTHSYATAGSYTVTLVGTSTTFGCIDSTTQVVKADALPVPLFTKTVATGCLPLNVVFSNTSTNAAFYIWNFGDGNTSSLLAPSHIYTQAGTYTITLIAQSSGGCTDSIKSQITVYPLPEAAFKQSSDTSCTVPILVNFSNASTGATSYAWNFGNGQVASNVNGNAAYGANGTYTIQLISTTSFGCSDTATSHFLVSPAPVANFSIGTLSGCQPLAVTFANQSQPGITYSWSFGDGGHSQLTSPTYVYNSPGTYSVQLTATSAAGCSNSQTISPGVTVLPTPEASFSYNQQLSGGKPVGTIAFVNTSTGGLSNSWNFGDQGTSKDPNPVHQYAAIGDYMAQLIVTNSAGCSDTVNQKVLVEYFQGLFVPNAFIPGSSFGEAAIFKPKGKSLRTYHIQIFNTWGTLLWESTALDANGSPAEFWDGTYQGIPCQQDAYVWKVDAIFENGSVWAGKKYPGGATRNTGTVTLIR
jgi:PKD repeat protein